MTVALPRVALATLSIVAFGVALLLLKGGGESDRSGSASAVVGLARAMQMPDAAAAGRALTQAGVPRVAGADAEQRPHPHAAVRVITPEFDARFRRGAGVVDTSAEFAIHTHDASGVVHLHPRAGERFSLTQLLAMTGTDPQRLAASLRVRFNDERPGALRAALDRPVSDRDDILIAARDDDFSAATSFVWPTDLRGAR